MSYSFTIYFDSEAILTQRKWVKAARKLGFKNFAFFNDIPWDDFQSDSNEADETLFEIEVSDIDYSDDNAVWFGLFDNGRKSDVHQANISIYSNFEDPLWRKEFPIETKGYLVRLSIDLVRRSATAETVAFWTCAAAAMCKALNGRAVTEGLLDGKRGAFLDSEKSISAAQDVYQKWKLGALILESLEVGSRSHLDNSTCPHGIDRYSCNDCRE